MNLRFGTVFADAGAMWRANREVLLAVIGVFVFLPVFAFNLFVPMPDLANVKEEDFLRVVGDWYVASAPWLVPTLVAQFFGSATVLALLLDAARPTVGEAIGRVVRLVPALVVALVASGLLIFGGSLLFLLPGMYAFGRCYLVWAVIVAEPGHGVVDGFVEGVKRTHGLGWRLFALGMIVVLPFYLLANILGGLTVGLDHAGVAGLSVNALIAAALSTAASLAQLLLQAGAYRAIRQGI